MPSLRALGEFKSSFNRIGGEADVLKELELPFDDLPLPGREPPAPGASLPGASAGQTAENGGSPRDIPGAGESPGTDFNLGDLSDIVLDDEIPGFPGEDEFPPSSAGIPQSSASPDPAPADSSPGQDDIDFGAFIDTIPDDFPPPDGSEDSSVDGDESALEEFGLPDDDFGLPSDPAAAGAGDIDPGSLSLDGDESAPEEFSLPDDDLGFPSDAAAAGAGDIDPGSLSLDGDESAPEEFSLPDDDLGFPSDPAAAGAGDIDPESLSLDGGESAPEEFSLPDDNLGFPSDPAATGAGDFDPGSLSLDSGESAPEEFNIPADLLNGFADEIEAEREYSGDETGADPALTDDENFEDGPGELNNFPDFDSGETLDLPGEESLPETETSGDSGAFSLSEEMPGFDDARNGGEADDFGINGAALESAALDEIPAESADGEDGFDYGEELREFDNSAVLEEIPGDSFDSFKMDADTFAADVELDGEDAGGFGELEEFSLPGIDTIPDGKLEPLGGASQRTSRKTGGARLSAEDADEIEEIRLSDEDFESLEATLSSYPLNLRIACEELIAEQAVAPDEMSRLVKLLVAGAPAREAARLAGKLLSRNIPIPRGFEKSTGEALEVEQSSFAYIFVHNFLPVLRLFMMAAAALVCTGYLCWRFIYTPVKAENIYRLGYERIGAGEYARANERFREAFKIHEKKSWFYEYARAFREARQYTLAEEKYGELLYYTASKNKRYIPEKGAVLEYAEMETNAIGNYEAADSILRRNILDYYPADPDALLALGDNSLAWGEYEPARLEDARESYARIMESYGRTDPLLERMLKYFIRTDNLEETLSLHSYFMASEKTKISAPALAELGGYFLDKRFEKVRGVPNEYLDRIAGIREILFRAIEQDSMLPESYYHLARYYEFYENDNDEKLTLDLAVKVFEAAEEESPKRIKYHINTLRRYGEILVNGGEFFPAEEVLVKGGNLYQDALSRRLLSPSPEFGRLYANLGDLEYFVKEGDMESALDYYRLGEQNGWAPPEIQYRMGAAHYQLREWGPALDRIFAAYREMPPSRRVLYALGNVSYMRGNYFAAQGYYDRLLEILNADRERFPPIQPSDDEKQLDLAERLMVAQNNLGVVLDALTERTGDNRYRSRAQGLYADSERAWDVLTRNPLSMLRMRPSPEISAPGINPAYLNVQNSLHPVPGYEPQFFLRIDKDINEPSPWEDLAPPGYRLSEGIHTGR